MSDAVLQDEGILAISIKTVLYQFQDRLTHKTVSEDLVNEMAHDIISILSDFIEITDQIISNK